MVEARRVRGKVEAQPHSGVQGRAPHRKEDGRGGNIMSKAAKWGSVQFRAKQARGETEDSSGPRQAVVLKDLFKHDVDRSARLRHYISNGPSGERDLEPILDKRLDEVLPSGQTRRERDAWLRGVLDSPE
jgi:hypothetical protein